MAVCRFEGNLDLYGLGIRLGFYFMWIAAIFGPWFAPSEVRTLRFLLNIFTAAAFLALIILTVSDLNRLQPVETYVTLLLIFGAYLALVPIYLWRLLTVCDPYWNPLRWPLVNHSDFESTLSLFLLIGALVYQLWFWFARIPILERYNCQQYGFVFGQVRLNSKVAVVVNALLYTFLGCVALYMLWVKIRQSVGLPPPGQGRKRRQISRRHKDAHINLMRNLDTWLSIIVASVVAVAIELTLLWNEIGGINTLAGIGQTIPFLIGIGAILRIAYVNWIPRYDDDGYDDSSDSYSSHSRRPRREGSLPIRETTTYSVRSEVRVPPPVRSSYRTSASSRSR